MLLEKQGRQRLMTAREIATYLAVNQRTVYRLVKEQRLPGYRVGGQWRFKLESIDGWIRWEQTGNYRHREKVAT